VILQRLARAICRETPGPFRMGLIRREWARIREEQAEAEIQAMAEHFGQAGA